MRTTRELQNKNFGLTEMSGRPCSSIDSAVKSLGRELVSLKAVSYGTVERWVQSSIAYAKWAGENGVPKNNLRSITIDHLKQFGAFLRSEVAAGRMATKTAHNILSNMNQILRQGSRSDRSPSCTGRMAGLPPKTGVAKYDKAVSQQGHDKAVAAMRPIPAAMAGTMRQLGLRFREAAKTDFKALARAVDKGAGVVTITHGTKGGLTRSVPLSSNPQTRANQVAAIRAAAALQGNAKSLVGISKQDYKSFRDSCYSGKPDGYRFHGERHAFAQRAFLEKLGVDAPAVGVQKGQRVPSKAEFRRDMSQKLGISYKEAQKMDIQARKEIALAMGHFRHDVVSAYLG